MYSLTPIGILPNAASVLGREHGCFNPAREGVAREQEGAAAMINNVVHPYSMISVADSVVPIVIIRSHELLNTAL